MRTARLSTTEDENDYPADSPDLTWWVRGTLLFIVGGLIGVFTLAVLLNPYNPDGTPRTMGTHTGPPLNLPDCTFKVVTGIPCPACGMTTSFSLLMHGDPINSLRANWVGTGLAVFCLLLIPWGIASIWLKRPLFIASLEKGLAISVVIFLIFMMLRWGIVLVFLWWQRHST
jgi:hypothetical protein